MYIPQDPPLVLHMLTSCMCRGGTWLGFQWAITGTEEERATITVLTVNFKRCRMIVKQNKMV